MKRATIIDKRPLFYYANGINGGFIRFFNSDYGLRWDNYLERRSTWTWLNTKQTIDFLCAWEKKHNPKFLVPKNRYEANMSVKRWIEDSRAIGIFKTFRNLHYSP